MAEKTRVEEGARSLERRMDMASQLIEGLAGERVRWNEDSKTFDETTRRLVGDCALACGQKNPCQKSLLLCIVLSYHFFERTVLILTLS